MSQTTTINLADLIDNGRVSGQHILVVTLCLIFNMVDGFDITAMAVTAHQVGEEMQLGADRLGLLFSFSLAGMMLGAMFLAGFSDVIGRRKMIIVSLLLCGSTVLLTAYATSLPMLIALRFISGLGAGALLATAATLASEYSPEKYRSLSVAVVTAGYPMGAMMTGILAGGIMPEFGWRGMFIAGGTATLTLAAIAFMLIPESLQFLCKKQPDDALDRANRILARFSIDPVTTLPLTGDDASTGADKQTVIQKMLSLLTPALRRRTLILWCTFFLIISSLYFLMSWIPKIMIDIGYGTDVGNRAFTFYNLGGVIGIFIIGALASRWMLSNLIAIFAITAGILMWVFAAAASSNLDQVILLALILIIGITLQGGFTGMYAVAAKIYPTEIRSTGVGWAIGLGRLGAVIGPGIAGVMIAAGLSITTNFLTFAVPLLIGGVLAYLLKVK